MWKVENAALEKKYLKMMLAACIDYYYLAVFYKAP